MKGRDFVIVGAIVAIAGLAVADAFRSSGGKHEVPRKASPPATTATDEPVAAGEIAVAQKLEPLPLSGSLVVTDAEDCHVRRISLASGKETRLPRLAGDCRLWVAPAGATIAYGLGSQSLDTELFRFVNLRRPEQALGGFAARFGFITWSGDGNRAAWCGRVDSFDLELGGAAHRLRRCPSAYAPSGAVAFARGKHLVVGARTVLTADGGITFVRWGNDGSVAVVVDGRRLERWQGGRLRQRRDLPEALQGRLPLLSPDNCAVLFRLADRVDLLDLGCFRGEAPRNFFRGAAAWSPDGRWIAVAEPQTVAFHRVVGPREVMRWPIAAAQIAWQP